MSVNVTHREHSVHVNMRMYGVEGGRGSVGVLGLIDGTVNRGEEPVPVRRSLA